MVIPPASPPSKSARLACLLGLGWCLASAQAPAPVLAPVLEPILNSVQGRVEVSAADGVWRAQTTPGVIAARLRTGTGRAALRQGRVGQVVMGSVSELRRYRNEVDLLSGKFLVRGPVAVHVQGRHLVIDGSGQARIDLSAGERRVAVIGGRLRIVLNGRILELAAGQQVALVSGRLTPFRETDPWYAAQFQGVGRATVEATRGPVKLLEREVSRAALEGDLLQAGAALKTGADAWAEIGFSGGGYLRLNAQSQLSVVSIERSSRGREVLLRLEQGTAWNVVERGQGGYRIDTPVLSTAVRGTVFRVDAAGLVKVFEGQVALPGAAADVVTQGQQREPGGQITPLSPDALDRFNLAQDAARAQPLSLSLEWPGSSAQGSSAQTSSVQALSLVARSLPGARLTLTVAGQTLDLSGEEGVFRFQDLGQTLPEGRHSLTVRAQRYGQTLQRTREVTVDRTPPQLSGLRTQRVGRVLTLSGTATDAGDPRVDLSVSVDAQTYRRSVDTRGGQPFVWHIPLRDPQAPATLTLRDRADNRSHVPLP